jgi:hypothetical protein
MTIEERSDICEFEIPKLQKRIRLRKLIQILFLPSYRNSEMDHQNQPTTIMNIPGKFQQNHACLHEISHAIVVRSMTSLTIDVSAKRWIFLRSRVDLFNRY